MPQRRSIFRTKIRDLGEVGVLGEQGGARRFAPARSGRMITYYNLRSLKSADRDLG